MFAAISKFTQKYRVIVIILWLAAAAALFIISPSFSDVAVTDESQFLPQDTQSSEAVLLLQEKFPGVADTSTGSGIIVIHNPDGLTGDDMAEAQIIRDWLVSDSGPQEIGEVISIFDSDLLRQKLVSSDQTTMMMQVSISASALSDEAKAAVSRIRQYLEVNHPNIQVYFTGETGLTQDLFESIQQTISKSTIVTIILVLLILLIIYRSPVAALLPLLAIGCSFLVTMGILGFMGQAGVKFFTLAEAYIVVIIFGIGTDYCLFIVSRFREELKKSDPKTALNLAMRNIGPVIAASALTVIVAFLCLGLSRFGMNKTSGYALALGIGVTLLAGLTLIPALMSLFGKYLFWPAWTSRARAGGRLSWAKIGEWVVKRPLLIALPIIVILVIPYVAFSGFTQTNDIISQMPGDTQSVQGYHLIEKHFPGGELSPVYLLIEYPEKNIISQDSLKSLKEIVRSIQSVPGVSRVDYYAAPESKLLETAAQIRLLGDGLGLGQGLENLIVLQGAGQELQGLILQYPGITQSQNFQRILAGLTQASALSKNLSTADQASLASSIRQIRSLVYDTANYLEALVEEFNLQVNSLFTASLLQSYFSSDATTARINLILTSGPYATETMETISRIREAAGQSINSSGLNGSSYLVGGESAVRADIMITNDADFGIVVGSAVGLILLVIIILLRSVVAPLYMVLTVLLNYGATLGLTTWVFSGLLKQSGMIYMLPIFIFIILVALGADYNIFLVSRIREEAQQRPLKEAISHAVANTGGVITSCGIILAGTFATLISTPLQMVMQLGAAIVIGVILDTFVVRAILVPSIAVLVGRWSWWPSRLSRKKAK